MVYTGIVSSGNSYQTNNEEIYRALIELQGRTHFQQAGVPRYLKADWLLHVKYMLHSMQI